MRKQSAKADHRARLRRARDDGGFRGYQLVWLCGAVIFLCLVVGSVWAAFPKKGTSYINDHAGLLTPQTRSQLEAVLRELEQKTSAEMAVVSVASLDGLSIEEYAVELFEQWGIGKKGKDNGTLLLVAPTERKVRIEVGYGLEGVITDLVAGQIIRDAVLPAFRQGKMSEGVQLGTLTLVQFIAKDANVQLSGGSVSPLVQDRPPQKKKGSFLGALLQILFLIFLIPIVIRHPWLLFFLLSSGRGGRHGGFGGGGFGGGFGGFGGGMSGGGGASGGW